MFTPRFRASILHSFYMPRQSHIHRSSIVRSEVSRFTIISSLVSRPLPVVLNIVKRLVYRMVKRCPNLHGVDKT